jgi:methionyl-tRNA formyltransferase
VTGVTTFVLEEGMDTGPILDQVRSTIDPTSPRAHLLDRLAELGAPVCWSTRCGAGRRERADPAAGRGVTLAPKITPDDVAIDFSPRPAVADLCRSADPPRGAHHVPGQAAEGPRGPRPPTPPADDADGAAPG